MHWLTPLLESRSPEKIALSFFDDGWKTLTFKELKKAVEEKAAALMLSGHKAGDRVALLSPSNPHLCSQFLGCLLSGVVAAPLDPKLSPSEIKEILQHLEPRSLIVAKEFRTLAIELQEELGFEKVLFLEQENLPPKPLPQPQPQELAAIYYTSGTLGNAKGVMVSGRALQSQLEALTSFRENSEQDVIYSILPLHHLYGLTAGFLYSLACGAEYVIAHSLAPQDISFCLQERKVTQISVVPLLLSLMRRGMLQKFSEQSPGKRRLLRFFLKICPFLPVSLRRILFRPVHEKLGGNLRRAVCGAAPLDAATYKFFHAIGIPIYEGYGLTETGPVLSVNTTRKVKMGTVGKPLPGVSIKIQDSEILAKGPNIMLGYFKNPTLTAEVVQDGWFHTGDLGRLERGYLRILGRKKSLIVLESGKKVHAEEVEQAIAANPHFQDVCVLGLPAENGEQITAVVVPSAEYQLQEEFEAKAKVEIQALCQKLATFKRPAKILLRREAFPKTSSGKIKRHLVRESL